MFQALSQRMMKQYHPVVWWLLGGTFLTRLTSFMVMPFMALYMGDHTHANQGVIGLAIGCAALTSMIASFFGGALADRLGRKPLMLLGMATSVVVMVGYANARAIAVFFLLSIGSGLTRAMFEPASQAVMAELTSLEQRGGVFALRYWAINLGAAVGPLVGGFFGTVATGWTFYLAALANFVYLTIIWFVVPATRPTSHVPSTMRQTFRVIAWDRALLLFLVAGLCSNLGYSQIESSLPQSMTLFLSPTAAGKLYGIVIASNAIEVVLLQLPITKLMDRMRLVTAMSVGQSIFAIGYLLMAFARSPWTYIAAMFVLTIGEIIVFPRNSQYTSLLARDDMRASYFGASSVVSLGFFLGPWFGGMVLHTAGPLGVFLTAAIIVGAGVPFYPLAERSRMAVSPAADLSA